MKIKCRECGTGFDYGANSGICPKCMTYHPWDKDGRRPKDRPWRRFCIWAAGTAAVSVLLLWPFLYSTYKEKSEEWANYNSEIKNAADSGIDQEVPGGETIHAGIYSLTPGTAFWMPEIRSVGMTDNGGGLLVVPVTVTVEEDKENGRDREVEFKLESQDDALGYTHDFYMHDACWPRLDEYTMNYGFGLKPEHELNYLVFMTDNKAEDITLCVEESVRHPRTYEATLVKTIRTPLDVTEEDDRMDPFFLEMTQFPVIVKQAGKAFDYSDSRILVERIRCEDEAGDFPVPKGKKLALVTLRRESECWPYSSGIWAVTAVTGKDGMVSANLSSVPLARWLDTKLSDLWGYYFDYNYESSHGKERGSERENPDTVYQCYLVDEDMTETEIIFPGVNEEEEDGPDMGYWQIRIPVEVPPAGGIISYGTGTSGSAKEGGREQ